jgi:phosphoglycerate-specific signal transduction histidine kinase
MRIAGLGGAHNRSRFKTALYLAFGGIAVILMIAVGLALYTSARLGQAVDHTTREILPETLAALRLSERSALLAALAPTLASANDGQQLQQLASQLDDLIREIDTYITRLNVRVDPNNLAILRHRVAFLATTLQTLKDTSADRIALAGQQTAVLAEIRKVHSELNDTISPVVYGVTSLDQLLAKRVVREQVAAMRELQEQHVHQVLAVMELRLWFDRLTAARRATDGSVAKPQEDLLGLMRAALARLRSAQPAEQEHDFAALAATVEQLFQTEPLPRSSDTLEREFEAALERYLERIKPYLAGHL